MDQLRELGELRVESGTGAWPDDKVAALGKKHDVILTNWGSRRLPEKLAEDPGRLRYVCNLSGEIRPFVPRRFVEKGIHVTNWGAYPAFGVAEAALALLLTTLKEFVPQRERIKSGAWNEDPLPNRGSMRDLRLGIYGMGVIGRAFVDMVRPLRPRISAYDRYAEEWPECIRKADTLDELFGSAEAVVITAALTGETRGSVSAGRLARLPEGGIVINVARGALIDQEALFRELENGRLRAGLDVLDSNGADWVQPGHPCRQWSNLILTGHKAASAPWNRALYEQGRLSRQQVIGLENIRRFVAGEPLQHLFDIDRYDRST